MRTATKAVDSAIVLTMSLGAHATSVEQDSGGFIHIISVWSVLAVLMELLNLSVIMYVHCIEYCTIQHCQLVLISLLYL